MSDSSFYKLTNPAFDFEWNGKHYQIKKANLTQVAAFQQKSQQLVSEKDPAPEQALIGFGLWLLLKDHIEGLTVEQVMTETPGAIVPMDLFIELGFMSPARFQAALEAAKALTMEDIGSKSPKEQGGLQSKSAS